MNKMNKELDSTTEKLNGVEYDLNKMKLKYEPSEDAEAAPEVAVQTDIGAEYFEEIADESINEVGAI
jgi:hypothetical protein